MILLWHTNGMYNFGVMNKYVYILCAYWSQRHLILLCNLTSFYLGFTSPHIHLYNHFDYLSDIKYNSFAQILEPQVWNDLFNLNRLQQSTHAKWTTIVERHNKLCRDCH